MTANEVDERDLVVPFGGEEDPHGSEDQTMGAGAGLGLRRPADKGEIAVSRRLHEWMSRKQGQT